MLSQGMFVLRLLLHMVCLPIFHRKDSRLIRVKACVLSVISVISEIDKSNTCLESNIKCEITYCESRDLPT